jgi:protein-S-isoprenylcysteine O-methyltransferase Ste14
VVSAGPYAVVRHPGYSGALLFSLASPAALGSVWALLPAVLTAAVLVLRTALEDRTLQKELAGYAEYAARVRWRLAPGLW